MVNMNEFQQFMNQMKGQDPQQIINNLIQTGKVTQAQLNQAQMQARQMQGEFESFKKMFGFK